MTINQNIKNNKYNKYINKLIELYGNKYEYINFTPDITTINKIDVKCNKCNIIHNIYLNTILQNKFTCFNCKLEQKYLNLNDIYKDIFEFNNDDFNEYKIIKYCKKCNKRFNGSNDYYLHRSNIIKKHKCINN